MDLINFNFFSRILISHIKSFMNQSRRRMDTKMNYYQTSGIMTQAYLIPKSLLFFFHYTGDNCSIRFFLCCFVLFMHTSGISRVILDLYICVSWACNRLIPSKIIPFLSLLLNELRALFLNKSVPYR